jgi:hypothetical protein
MPTAVGEAAGLQSPYVATNIGPLYFREHIQARTAPTLACRADHYA